MAKVIRKELEQKLAALDGAEWDSMSESDASGGDVSDGDDQLQPPPLPLHAKHKKGKRKGGKAAAAGEASVVPVGPAGEPSGVVYIGHIPHGFYEEAMNGFFKQFGDVIRVRISRSKKSGRCKGYAYVEFVSPEVANVVADTMNNYILFDKQLVCRVLRFEEIHPNLFDGAGVKFRKVNWHGLYRQKYNADRTPAKDEKHTAKLLKKDKLKKAKLAKLGIEYDFPGFVATLNNREVAEGPFQEPESSGRSGKGGKGSRKEKEAEAVDGVAPNAIEQKPAPGKAKVSPEADDAAPSSAKKSRTSNSSPASAATPKGKANAKTPTKKKSAEVLVGNGEGEDVAVAPAAAAAAAAAAAPAAAGGKGVKSPGSGKGKGSGKKGKGPKTPETATEVVAAAAAAAAAKSPGSGKGKKGSGKKGKGPNTPEPAAAAAAAAAAVGAVGSEGKKKKKAKSPKGGGGGKKRSLEDAEAADDTTPVRSTPGSGRKTKSAKRVKA